MGNWQPIETAPKDGAPILVWDDGAMFMSWWVESEGESGWWDHGFVDPPPSHWMPLPDPPSVNEGSHQ